MPLFLRIAILSIVALLPSTLLAQLPPGYWSYYDSGNKHYHRRQSGYEVQRQRSHGTVPHDPWARPGPAADPMNYEGRGMSSSGLSAYQNNGYNGPNQDINYGYWDGGFQPGLYGFSMYSHFDRPGFTYWQSGF